MSRLHPFSIWFDRSPEDCSVIWSLSRVAFTVIIWLAVAGGCSSNAPGPDQQSDSSIDQPLSGHAGVLKLGQETFAVDECEIWGYLARHGDQWYCRWCISAEGAPRVFERADGGEPYTFEAQPSLAANGIPIEASAWRDLDNKRIKTGKHGQPSFFDGSDPSAFYTLRTISSFELCHNNDILIEHVGGIQFRVTWTGESYFHGVSAESKFTLNATATLRSISFSSEVDDETDVDESQIANIFTALFPNQDFQQQPTQVRRIDEDGVVTTSFEAEFTPK